MAKITIEDLEVRYRVGVPDEERAQPQRLLLTIEMDCDFAAAICSDSLADTVDYHAVCQRLLKHGHERSWKLIERLADDLARLILEEFEPDQVRVVVKKFVIPEARLVSVSVTRTRSQAEME